LSRPKSLRHAKDGEAGLEPGTVCNRKLGNNGRTAGGVRQLREKPDTTSAWLLQPMGKREEV
jgi:hypothetical protein